MIQTNKNPRSDTLRGFFMRLSKCFFQNLHLTNSVIYGIILLNHGDASPNNERDGESGMDDCGSRAGADPIPSIAPHLLL